MIRGLLLFLFLLGVDIGTKGWALQSVPYLEYGSYPFGGIALFSWGGVTGSLNRVFNTGAAWGILAGYSAPLFALRLGIIAFLLFFIPKRAPIWLILSGAFGNVVDYCLYGHVVDFFHLTFWGYSFPIFNVADCAITLGVLTLFLFPFKTGKEADAV